MFQYAWFTRGVMLTVFVLLALALASGPLAVGQQRRGRRAPPQSDRGGLLIDDLAAPRDADREPAPAPHATDARQEAEAGITRALAAKSVADFEETPLRDAIDFLKEQHGIEIQLDARALEDQGIGSDTPVTRSLKNITLASTLDLLLGDLELTYLIRDEVLLITSIHAAESLLETRVYPVGDLVTADNSAGDQDLDGRYELLVDTILQSIGGKEAKKHGSVQAYPPSRALVVHQPQPVHRQVQDVLAQLRRARQHRDDRP
ncbi:MAG TPA: hypothetical protein VF306_04700 [Pirellulales bacterium]